MITECHYCPTSLDTMIDDVYFTNSAYGTNHPTCQACNEKHTPQEPIFDYPIKKDLSCEFKEFLLSLRFKETFCYN